VVGEALLGRMRADDDLFAVSSALTLMARHLQCVCYSVVVLVIYGSFHSFESVLILFHI